MSLYKYSLKTLQPMEIVNIDHFIEDAIEKSEIESGTLFIFSPHTTCGITINENADPDVLDDLIYSFKLLSPKRREFLHQEGNSHAHLLSSLIGASEEIIIENGRPLLGIWQSIYFCDFDGPRNRKLFIKIKND